MSYLITGAAGRCTAESFFDLKPVQKPRPPIYMAAYTPAAMDRVARLADVFCSDEQGLRKVVRYR